MSCQEWRDLLEPYLDGELDERSAKSVSAHVAACAACASAFERLQREQDFYLRYESEVEIAPAFWANITARIDEEQAARAAGSFSGLRQQITAAFGLFRAPRLSLAFTVLLVAAAIGLTVLVMRGKDSTPQQQNNQVAVADNNNAGPHPALANTNEAVTPPPTIVNEPSNLAKDDKEDSRKRAVAQPRLESRRVEFVSATEKLARRQQSASVERRGQTTDELVREAEQKYLAAIALLARDVNRRRTQLDPQTAAQFKQTLAAVDRTIAGTRRAVREHPEDPVAVQYMLSAYAKKVEVLREMVNQ